MQHVRLSGVLLVLIGGIVAADELPRFREVVIDPEIGKVCYAVTLADVDGDSRQDIVAVSENSVYWYQNPGWERRVIIQDQTPRDNVCIAPFDIDGDGQVDFALGASWSGPNLGTIHWLRRKVSLDENWQVFSIGAEPWLHRMQFADVLHTGRPQLVISPLNAVAGPGVRVRAFEIPQQPESDRWPDTLLNADFNRMHNHWHLDWDSQEPIDTLTASREGIHLLRLSGDSFSVTKVGTGAVDDEPNRSGAGEIKSGRLASGRKFFCTVEPMHGTMLAVYLPPQEDGALWERIVIDKGFRRGHALWTADLNGDGNDEIIFGHSDTPQVPGVNVYGAVDAAGRTWEKSVVDAGGMATEDLIVGDLDGDGRPDIVAGGRATQNVKLYWNLAP